MIHISKTSEGEGFGIDVEEVGWNFIRRRECHSSATYASEFAQALPRSVAGGIETIESLQWFERRIRRCDAATYLV